MSHSFHNARGTRGILPSDSIALERNNRLRKERQSEYQDFLKRRDHNKRTVAEMRIELSSDREAELGQRKVKLDSLGKRLEESNADNSYAALQAKKLTEERQYRGDPCCFSKPRKHMNTDEDGNRQDHSSNNNFACNKISDASQHQKSSWDEEEKGLMQWTKNMGCHFKAQPDKENTPPGLDSARRNEADSRAMLRSISAPISATGMPLPGWSGNDSHVQKMKKIKYAEDLRNQIREKKASVKYDDSLHRAADQHLSFGRLSRTRADRSMADNSSNETHSSLHHKDYSECEGVRKPAPMATRSRDNSMQEYPFYNLPPPPPASFQGHHGVPWIPPMYPYPNFYDRESYPKMYHHPYYYPQPPHSYPPPPDAINPYSMPPSHHHESRKHLPLREPGRGEEHHDLIYHDKRNYSPPSPLIHESNAWRGRRDEDKNPKISNKIIYRKELEKQMREKKEREMKENMAKESLDRKRENKYYDPFGKGGCGAPVRDQHGNLVADLKQMRKINENRLSNNSLKLKNSAGEDSDTSGSSPPQKASHVVFTYGKRTDEDIKKSTQVHYRDFLFQQVKEKEELKMKEKEQQRIEEKKELEHLERDRRRIQEEYQRELNLQKIKLEQAHKKNEAIVLEVERDRQRVLMQREQEFVQEEKEQRSFAEKELVEKLSCSRGDLSHNTFKSTSPPIPTLRRQMKATLSVSTPSTKPQNHFHGNLSYQPASSHRLLEPSSPNPTEKMIDHPSPPVPALRKKKTNPSNIELETSKANSHASLCLNPHASSAVASTRISCDRSQVLDDTRIAYTGVSKNPSSKLCVNAQDHTLGVNHDSVRSQRSNSSNAVVDARSLFSRTHLSALDSEEILTKLGAIRMHLQEELAKQNCESRSQSGSFDRARRHEPRIAAPLKPKFDLAMQTRENINKLKYSCSTEQGEFLEINPEVPHSESTLAEQQGALLRHQQALRRNAQMNVEKQKGNTYGKDSVGKDSYVSREGSALPPEFSLRSLRYPFSNNNGSKASLPGEIYPNIDDSSMATKNGERIKRLEAILKSGTYSKPPSLGARVYSSGSLKQEGKRS